MTATEPEARPTCQEKKTLLMGGCVEVDVECGKEANHDGDWHAAQETLEEKEGERRGFVQFHWR